MPVLLPECLEDPDGLLLRRWAPADVGIECRWRMEKDAWLAAR